MCSNRLSKLNIKEFKCLLSTSKYNNDPNGINSFRTHTYTHPNIHLIASLLEKYIGISPGTE